MTAACLLQHSRHPGACSGWTELERWQGLGGDRRTAGPGLGEPVEPQGGLPATLPGGLPAHTPHPGSSGLAAPAGQSQAQSRLCCGPQLLEPSSPTPHNFGCANTARNLRVALSVGFLMFADFHKKCMLKDVSGAPGGNHSVWGGGVCSAWWGKERAATRKARRGGQGEQVHAGHSDGSWTGTLERKPIAPSLESPFPFRMGPAVL